MCSWVLIRELLEIPERSTIVQRHKGHYVTALAEHSKQCKLGIIRALIPRSTLIETTKAPWNRAENCKSPSSQRPLWEGSPRQAIGREFLSSLLAGHLHPSGILTPVEFFCSNEPSLFAGVRGADPVTSTSLCKKQRIGLSAAQLTFYSLWDEDRCPDNRNIITPFASKI